MGVIATLDPVAWAARYPEFATLSSTTVTALFNEATVYHANDGSGPVNDMNRQTLLLWMLTAHIAAINYGMNGDPPSPIVGRVSSATQGSVSVSADMAGVPGSAAWFMATKYGAAYWQGSAAYRTAQFRTGPRRYFA